LNSWPAVATKEIKVYMTDWSVSFFSRCSVARKQTARRSAATKSVRSGSTRRAIAPAGGVRAARQAERRDAILAAALDEFAASGFAATRLDDIARRAGVAKGTIYLYFRDKESLFQELVRTMLSPMVGTIETAQLADRPARAVADMIVDLFAREVFGTRRKDVMRLVITEGARFPKLAEFYYHEVIERVLAAMRTILSRAAARGELPNDALVRFPQLLVTPALLTLVWNGMFDRFTPLDFRALMQAHLDILFGKRTSP
jgi:AcrR family transcriptional regulator